MIYKIFLINNFKSKAKSLRQIKKPPGFKTQGTINFYRGTTQIMHTAKAVYITLTALTLQHA